MIVTNFILILFKSDRQRKQLVKGKGLTVSGPDLLQASTRIAVFPVCYSRLKAFAYSSCSSNNAGVAKEILVAAVF